MEEEREGIEEKEISEDIDSAEAEGEIAAAEAAIEIYEGYSDSIAEQFSAENNAERIANATKIPKKIARYSVCALYLAVGVLCISITEIISLYLAYIVGSLMIAMGVVRFIFAVIHREYRDVKTNQTVTSLILAALGVMIIIQQLDESNDSAIMLVSVVWGILGLFEGAHAFNEAITRITRSERCIFFIIKGIVELAVAFILLYRPDSHEAHHLHIIVFGINMIFDAITMFPLFKKLFAIK